MSDATVKKGSAGKWIALALLAAAGFGAYKWLGSSEPADTGIVFDPSVASELVIKGAQPDGTVAWGAQEVPASPAVNDALLAKGKEIYTKACAACHGDEGKGDGLAVKKYTLTTPPANFTKPLESIKIRSTMIGSPPLDEDMFRTITRGMPNTAMLSFAGLPAEERWAVIHYTKTFWKLPATAKPIVVEIPPKPPFGEAIKQLGKNAYEQTHRCVNCHGVDGTGSRAAMFDPNGDWPYPGVSWARNGGTRTLGGSSEEDLARTLMTGFHDRSPMRSFKSLLYMDDSPVSKERGDKELWGLVFYVRGLMEAQKK